MEAYLKQLLLKNKIYNWPPAELGSEMRDRLGASTSGPSYSPFVRISCAPPTNVIPSDSTCCSIMGVGTMGATPLLQLPPCPMLLPSILYTTYLVPSASWNPEGSMAPPWLEKVSACCVSFAGDKLGWACEGTVYGRIRAFDTRRSRRPKAVRRRIGGKRR